MAEPDYFTLDELRELPDLDDDTRFPDDRCLAEAAAVTAIVEREVGTSFIPRPVTELLDGNGCDNLVLSDPFAVEVTAISVGGTALVPATDLLAPRSGILRFATLGRTWLWGRSNVSVTYTAGYSDEPPADIKDAVMKATRWRLLESEATSADDPRRTKLTNELGGEIQLGMAGTDHPTGYPPVDAVIVGWREQLDLGFA